MEVEAEEIEETEAHQEAAEVITGSEAIHLKLISETDSATKSGVGLEPSKIPQNNLAGINHKAFRVARVTCLIEVTKASIKS